MLLSGTNQLIDVIEITLRGRDSFLTVYVDVFDNSLSHKWLDSLNYLLQKNYHLEKNYCFFGFVNGSRNGKFIIDQINKSIQAINSSDIGYAINDHFTLENSIISGAIIPEDQYPTGQRPASLPGEVNHDHFNNLHRYFEDLQGVSGHMTEYYNKADSTIRWHIRQLNLLCHEFENWAISNRKKFTAPAWVRPSQLMCWLNAPRFMLTKDDYELFGVETMNRPLGGVYVGVNKAIGKHHWEVFVDEAGYNPNSLIDNLTTTTMRSQLEAAGDFDIEWGNNPGNYEWQKRHLADFKQWLINNHLDPDDKSLTIGHPQVGQTDLMRSFDTDDYSVIWSMLEQHSDVYSIKTSKTHAEYNYRWSDEDFIARQIEIIEKQ
jgi:hypothetical protein